MVLSLSRSPQAQLILCLVIHESVTGKLSTKVGYEDRKESGLEKIGCRCLVAGETSMAVQPKLRACIAVAVRCLSQLIMPIRI